MRIHVIFCIWVRLCIFHEFKKDIRSRDSDGEWPRGQNAGDDLLVATRLRTT